MSNGLRIDPRNLPLMMQLQIAMQILKLQEEKTARGEAAKC